MRGFSFAAWRRSTRICGARERGIQHGWVQADTARMRHDTQAFNWDRERTDDRPSEFKTSTSYSLLHGDDDHAHRQRRAPPSRHHRSGAFNAWRALSVVLFAGTVAIYLLAKHVRG